MIKSDFDVLRVSDQAIFIVDLNLGHRSVTNDAENVVAALVATHGNKRIMYRDSDFVWAELVHENGVFKGFADAAEH